jgi:pimeloyl-ACP methyl ester carboxylesterase
MCLLMLVSAPVAAQSQSEEVRIESAGAVLAGTLTFPEGETEAAVIMIQGAGPHDRDQTISGTPMFANLASQLAEHGIASLRIDNPGIGASTGRPVEHFKQRVPHIAAAFDAMAAHPRVADAPVGLLGHSEGSMVASEVWLRRADFVDFVVLLGAPTREGRAVWVEQQSNPERFPDFDASALAEIRVIFKAVADASIAGDEPGVGRAADRLFALVGMSPEEIADVQPGFVSRMASPEMQVFLAHDPSLALARMTAPMLAIWGSHDDLVDPQAHIPVLLANRHADGALTVMVLPREDHFFLRADGLAPGQHEFGAMQLSPKLAAAIRFWLGEIVDGSDQSE